MAEHTSLDQATNNRDTFLNGLLMKETVSVHDAHTLLQRDLAVQEQLVGINTHNYEATCYTSVLRNALEAWDTEGERDHALGYLLMRAIKSDPKNRSMDPYYRSIQALRTEPLFPHQEMPYPALLNEIGQSGERFSITLYNLYMENAVRYAPEHILGFFNMHPTETELVAMLERFKQTTDIGLKETTMPVETLEPLMLHKIMRNGEATVEDVRIITIASYISTEDLNAVIPETVTEFDRQLKAQELTYWDTDRSVLVGRFLRYAQMSWAKKHQSSARIYSECADALVTSPLFPETPNDPARYKIELLSRKLTIQKLPNKIKHLPHHLRRGKSEAQLLENELQINEAMISALKFNAAMNVPTDQLDPRLFAAKGKSRIDLEELAQEYVTKAALLMPKSG